MVTVRCVLATLLVGCGGSDPGGNGAEPIEPDPPDTVTEWAYEGEPDPPQFDQGLIEEAIQVALADVLTLTGTAPLHAYTDLMDTADDYCPYYSEFQGSVYWYGGCETGEGVTYQGYSFYQYYEDAPLFGEGSTMSGPVLNTQGSIILPDGTRFDMGGSTHTLEGQVSEEMYAWSTAVTGAFGWTDNPEDETWMGGAIKPTIETTALMWDFEEHGRFRGVETTAGLTGLSSTWDTVFLSELTSMDDLFGYWPCPEEAAGSISVRSDKGHWFEVVYDVVQDPADDEYDIAPGLCDGCGQVYVNGEEVGEACNDFSVLRDWEDQPW